MRKQIMGMVQALPLVLVVVAAALMAATTGEEAESCLRRCGNVDIPYPFGTTPGCRYVDEEDSFLITCNDTHFDPPKPFYRKGNLQITGISIADGEMNTKNCVARDCYSNIGAKLPESSSRTLGTGPTFTVSPTKNKFMAMGCDANARLVGNLGDQSFSTGCLSFCSGQDYVEDSCSGVGCCETPIPDRLGSIGVFVGSSYNYTNTSGDFSNCSYAFMVVKNFNFSAKYLREFNESMVPVVLDWTVRNQTCETAKTDPSSYLCKENSFCVDKQSRRSNAYLCKCLDGYHGNPYVVGGCQDINECEDYGSNQCQGTCINLPGNFTCACPKGHKLSTDGISCTKNASVMLLITLGSVLGLLVVFLAVSVLYIGYKERKETKQKHNYFQQNGGMLLRQKLTGSGQELIRIFSADELRKATRNYHESRILGKGGQGTVFKGILADNTTVAIKKSRIGDATEVDQFVKEIFLLSQIKHENVVKILGCCLETEVPLLVYEFIEHGSLFDHMHKSASHHDNSLNISWRTRLKIASQTASALSHLHSAAPPIVHRDVKLANILLDENYNAKVSDFGASRLMPANRSELTTLVQGTLGYLDPEYFHTNQLTEKSDVYSFGVVLIELLTGQKVIDFERPKDEMNIALRFISLMREERLLEIIDNRLLEVADESVVKQLKEVADIARTCVRMRGEERPSMLEIGYELEALKELGVLCFPRFNLKANLSAAEEESDHLLGDLYRVPLDDDDEVTSSSMGFDSINKHMEFDIESAR